MNDKQTIIYLLRHGQTQWNLEKRMQGNMDSPLTDLGISQANKARASLAGCDLRSVYTSPLGRALQTAEIVLSGTDLIARVCDSFREISLGPWEGEGYDQVVNNYPIEHQNFWHCQDKFSLLGAETFRQVQKRIADELESIFNEQTGSDILIVSHWIAIKVAIAHYSDTPLSQLNDIADIENGGFIKLVKTGSAVSIA